MSGLLESAERVLSENSVSPRLDAEVLLSHVTGKPRSALRAWPDAWVARSEVSAFESLLVRRRRGEPVAYLTGSKEFWSMSLKVTPDTLIPRPETELLVEVALESIPLDASIRVLELGTGSGAVALALARERPACDITASDNSPRALAVARENAQSLKLDRIRWVESDWLDKLSGPFDLIVSNPPYVPAEDPHLLSNGVAYEPRPALAAGADGLRAIRIIGHQAPHHLVTGGRLILEHGAHQAERVKEILTVAGFQRCRCHHDIAGHPRVTEGWRR